MTTKESIAAIKANIRDEYEAIGRATVECSNEGIAYHTMHLKAYQAQLAKLEEKLDKRRGTIDDPELLERCIAITRKACQAYKVARNNAKSNPSKMSSALKRSTYSTYSDYVTFASELLHMDENEFQCAVEEVEY